MECPVTPLAVTPISTAGLSSQQLISLLYAHETPLSIAGVVNVRVILQYKLAVSLFDVLPQLTLEVDVVFVVQIQNQHKEPC